MKSSFYGPIRARAYDIGTDVSDAMIFYLEHWKRLGCPEPLIEPMCGTGLNMLWYWKEGIQCDGLDASPYMLEECRKNLAVYGFQSRLYHQKIEEMTLDQLYGYMFIPRRSLGHIYDNSIAMSCLKRIHEHLTMGGWLVLDVKQQSYLKKYPKDGSVYHHLGEDVAGGTVFTTEYWQYLDNGRVIRSWNKTERFVENTLTETEIFDYYERMYEENELREMLMTAGFRDIHITKAYEHDTVPGTDDGIVFSCQKT